jgi:uncharacterized repeat protein (TIGR03803 family)
MWREANMRNKKITTLTRLRSFRASGALILTALMLVFAAAAATAQTYTDLYNFSNNGGPNDPQYSGIIAQGRDGNLYSTTNQNWTGGLGDLFKITPMGTLTVLHNFHGTDGEAAVSGLTLATNGDFYGATYGGGANNFGTIFSITAGGKLTTLYSFTNGAHGGSPQAPPIQGLDGNFYGTTYGIDGNNGSVYKITPSGEFTTLYSFDGTHGANPIAPLVQATNGNFYGTTNLGGTNGAGTIFRISASGKFKVLFNFGQVPGYPFAPLIQGNDGNFYGTTPGSDSGSAGGVAFKITPGGTLTVLHTFTGEGDGSNQIGGLVQATDGNFYGTNNIGGNGGQGTIFRVGSTGAFETLYGFPDCDLGGNPQTTLLQHTNGVLYGTTAICGTSDEGVFYSFDVGLKPFVSFLPAAGKGGSTIEFLGQGFKGTTGVSFNGTPATFKVVSGTYLTATVPNGATSGFVTVTTPKRKLNSNKKFRVTQ